MKWATAPLQALLATLILAALPPGALALQSATIHAALRPEHLGAGTTIEFGFRIAAPHGAMPSPLIGLDLRYPANINIVNSGLGLAACTLRTLELVGPEGCPAESLMGHGNALIEIPIGPEIIHETGNITTWMGPIEHGHLGLVFYASAYSPVYAQATFPGIVLAAPPPYGLSLSTKVPLIETLPGAPDAAVIALNTSIGPKDITYYAHTHGKIVPYQPDGLLLPSRCPHGGFPFAATFTFLDGSNTNARTAVPCPRD